jgi:predicted RNA binding protein YcfA (HicA-like mRNA interferase family)
MKSIFGKEFCRILERHGWVLLRINGSHHIYGKPKNPERIIVPAHGNKSLKFGLLKAMLNAAGIPETP